MNHIDKNWPEFYKGRMGEGYGTYAEKRYKPFIEAIVKYVKKDSLFREEGCGLGTISRILMYKFGYRNQMMFDINPEMVQMAAANTDYLIPTYKGDILGHNIDLGFKVIHSHGVLEHFSDDQILTILERQKNQAQRVVHYVPTDGYESPSYGDERLLPFGYWVELTKPTSFELFNDNKDLLMVWEK